jgi:hypothetical protein
MTPDDSSNGRATRVLWAAGTLLFGAAVILIAARERDEGVASALVAAVGTGAVALLVATIARFAWIRLGGRGALLAPSLLLIAGLLSLAALGAHAAEEGAETAAREDAGDECTATSPDPFPAPTADLSYRALTLDEEERLRTEAGVISDTAIAAGKHVDFGDQSLANMVAIPGYQGEAERDELFDRLGQAVSTAEADSRSIEGLAAPGQLAVFKGKPKLITTAGCYAILIGGENEEAILYVARALFPEDATTSDGLGGG